MLGRALLGLAILTPASALAADPIGGFGEVPPVIPFIEAADPMADLTGAYVGGSIGYGFELNHGVVTTGTPGFLGLAPAITPNEIMTDGEGGFTGTLHAGVNVGISEGFVLGGEVDLTIGQLDTEASFTGQPVLGTAGLRTSADLDVDWLGTARAKAGVMLFDDLLVYGTAGLAFGKVGIDAEVVAINDPSLMWTGHSDELETGYAVGLGGEFAVTPNVSLRADYLYYNLGDANFAATGNPTVRTVGGLDGIDYEGEAEIDGHLIKAGINVRLGSLF